MFWGFGSFLGCLCNRRSGDGAVERDSGGRSRVRWWKGEDVESMVWRCVTMGFKCYGAVTLLHLVRIACREGGRKDTHGKTGNMSFACTYAPAAPAFWSQR